MWHWHGILSHINAYTFVFECVFGCVCVCVYMWVHGYKHAHIIYTHIPISLRVFIYSQKKKKDLRNVWKDTNLISNSLGSMSNKRSKFKHYVVQIILRSLLHCHGYQPSQIKQNSVGSFHCRCCLWKLNETIPARAEQKLHCWSRNKQRRAHALKTPSPWGKGGQKLLRGKR